MSVGLEIKNGKTSKTKVYKYFFGLIENYYKTQYSWHFKIILVWNLMEQSLTIKRNTVNPKRVQVRCSHIIHYPLHFVTMHWCTSIVFQLIYNCAVIAGINEL